MLYLWALLLIADAVQQTHFQYGIA